MTAGLAHSYHQLENHYDVVVIGSGYGGAIAASRLARAGRRVCILERGKEYLPHDFPDTLPDMVPEVQVDAGKNSPLTRNKPLAMMDFRAYEDLDVLIGCGLGGTSLINANVSIKPDPRVFKMPGWPGSIRNNPQGLDAFFNRAKDMLKPVPYPEGTEGFPKLRKTAALKKGSQNAGGKFSLLDINVNFEPAGPNHVGTHQEPCQNCGDCVSGCRHRAKNTLAVNYLPDARNHGAHIFTQIKVHYIDKAADEAYRVYYCQQPEKEFDDQPAVSFIRADQVVVAAGSLGSTEILLQSKNKGLKISERLGERFSGNGDVLAFGYNNDQEVGAVGFGSDHQSKRDPVGPCITSVNDMHGPQKEVTDGMIIEEGVIPGLLGPLLPHLLSAGSVAFGEDTDTGLVDGAKEMLRSAESLLRGFKYGAVLNTQTYLVMSHDGAKGKLRLKGDRIEVDWPGYADLPVFKKAEKKLYETVKGLGGTFLPNLLTEKLLGKNGVTVHPLGGCIMGDDRHQGVVDHRCEVFDASASSPSVTHDGLFVMDGAVIPVALGVNPLYTICAVVERACALIAREQNWEINYAFPVAPNTPAPSFQVSDETPIGYSFTEIMRGYGTTDSNLGSQQAYDSGKALGPHARLDFKLTVTIDNLKQFIEERDHLGSLTGTVTCPALSAEALSVSKGRFNLFTADSGDPKARQMHYNMVLSSAEGADFYFSGKKDVRDDVGFDVWKDTTTLQVEIRKGKDKNGPVAFKGIQRIFIKDLLKQTNSMSPTRAGSLAQKLQAQTKFGIFFFGNLWETYIADLK